jgi:hypothetical protein
MSRRTTLNCFRDYVTLKLHFNSEAYVWHEAAGHKIKEEALFKRTDQYFFEAMTAKYPDQDEQRQFFVSAFLRDQNFWIGDWRQDDVVAYHKNRLRRANSLIFTFNSDVENITEFMDEKKVPLKKLLLNDGDRPLLIKHRSSIIGGVTDETISLLDRGFCFLKQPTENPFWKAESFKLHKYRYFLSIPKEVLVTNLNLLANRGLGAQKAT